MHDPEPVGRLTVGLAGKGTAWFVAAALLVVAGCGAGNNPSPSRPQPTVSAGPTTTPAASGPALRYVALGDSYTIGTSVTEPERWPDQLVAGLVGDPVRLDLVANLAVNGFTSADVIAVELPRLDELRPGFVTLLIGVNDVVQGVPEATYRERLVEILTALRARLPASRILVVTTPDYTVTPAGADYGDPTARRSGIRRVNAIATEESRRLGIVVVDIFDISARAATDTVFVARDGLHPSGRQYALWVERIAPAVRALLAS